MSYKKCPTCGKFMHLTDRLPKDDQFDYELARECGLTQEQIDKAYHGDSPYSRFFYVQDQWECGGCFKLIPHTEGQRYYYNPFFADYNGTKPLTPHEKKALAQKDKP